MDRWIDGYVDIWIYGYLDIWIDWKVDKQTKQTDGRSDGQIENKGNVFSARRGLPRLWPRLPALLFMWSSDAGKSSNLQAWHIMHSTCTVFPKFWNRFCSRLNPAVAMVSRWKLRRNVSGVTMNSITANGIDVYTEFWWRTRLQRIRSNKSRRTKETKLSWHTLWLTWWLDDLLFEVGVMRSCPTVANSGVSTKKAVVFGCV